MGNGSFSTQWIHLNKPILKPYSSRGDERFDRYKKLLQYLYDWKKEVDSTPNLTKEEKKAKILSQQTLDAWERICHGIPAAIEFLLQQGQKYVNARIFSQDPLEQHFSKQRGACGSNRNPNVLTYGMNENAIHFQGKMSLKRRGANTKSCPSTVDDTPLPKRRKVVRRAILPS